MESSGKSLALDASGQRLTEVYHQQSLTVEQVRNDHVDDVIIEVLCYGDDNFHSAFVLFFFSVSRHIYLLLFIY